MTIKPKKEYYQMITVVFCAITSLFVILLFDGARLYAVVFYGVLSFIYLRYWMATGRTFVMSQDGCTVSFLWYTKEYKWDDFQVKAIEDFSHANVYLSAHKKGAIFSKRPIHKPWWWEPAVYSINIHPLSFVYVNFIPERKYPGEVGICEIDEEIFLKKMKEWNIALEEVNFYSK